MRIDVHAHLWSDEYLDLIESYGQDVSAQRSAASARAEAARRWRPGSR
jgi:hypothetical protein